MNGLGPKGGEGSSSDETGVPAKRRKRSVGEKQRIVEASLKPGTSVRALAKTHGLDPTQLYKWRRLYGCNREEKSGAALLPVRVTEESAVHNRPRNGFKKPEATRSITIHLEFTHVRVQIENADRATVLGILEHLAR
jgi:transposase-like protein